MRRLVLFAAATAFLCTAPSDAQDPVAIGKVRASQNFRTAAEAHFRDYEDTLSTRCGVVKTDWPHAIDHIYGQPQTAPNGNLVSATWVETVPGNACGQAERFRVLVTIRNGSANLATLLPGESFATPQLEQAARTATDRAIQRWKQEEPQRIAAKSPGPHAVVVPPDCVSDVIDTQIAGPAPISSRQAWNEVWTIHSCGRTLSVPVRFVPDTVGEGTGIRVESKDIKPLR